MKTSNTVTGRRLRLVSGGGGRRRGAVLIVVLTMLAMFVILGVTYALLSSQFSNSAIQTAKQQQLEDPPERMLDRVMYQLVRGPDHASSLLGHDLLGDLWGSDGVRGVITTTNQPVAYQANGQLISFEAVPDPATMSASSPWYGGFQPISDYYNGSVLTMLTHPVNGAGPARGISTRVVQYRVDLANQRLLFVVEAFEPDSDVVPLAGLLPQDGHLFVINGRAFNGFGHGYHPVNRDLSAPEGSPLGPVPAALLPHFSGYGGLPRIRPNVGGEDESWDAVDFQNMFLAMVPPRARQSSQVIPSLHRPALVNFWRAQISGVTGSPPDLTDPATVAFFRKFVLRPMPWDHPSFSGSNGAFDPALSAAVLVDNLVTGVQWDVDNDNDGIPDSIWIDVGFPLQTAPSGRKYRILAAILCQDLDNRLNLNANGSLTHNPSVTANLINAIVAGDFQLQPVPAGSLVASQTIAGLPSPPPLAPRGGGFGPAETHLGPAFFGNGNEMEQVINARHGADGRAGWANTRQDSWSVVHHAGLPNAYTDATQPRQEYGTQSDPHGYGAHMLDVSGQPLRPLMERPGSASATDLPYEMQLANNGHGDRGRQDRPFSVHELERLLRYYDVDARSLPDRLLRTAPNSWAPELVNPAANASVREAARHRRRIVTTHSSHLPVINDGLPLALDTLIQNTGSLANTPAEIGRWNLGPDGAPGIAGVDDDGANGPDDPGEVGWPNSDDGINPASLMGLFAAKLLAGGVAPANLDAQLQIMVPFEIRHGQRMNVNRKFGNGIDDNNNGVVDEPFEAQNVWSPAPGPADPLPPGYAGLPGNNYRNDDGLPQLPYLPSGLALDDKDGRQMYARHLYCLMMLMADQGFFQNVVLAEATLNNQEKRELMARRIAQWAINVVDFRDPDAIMTPFEFDLNPFNGWNVDGILHDATAIGLPGPDDTNHPERAVVWGMEYPDLLLNESLAFHDKRIKDTANDTTGTDTMDTNNPDNDWDQIRIPQGSLFLELYCARNRQVSNGIYPGELYVPDAMGNWGLDLGRLAPESTDPTSGNAFRMPVWRVAFSVDHLSNQPASPDVRRGTMPDSTSFEPNRMSLLRNVNEVLNIERIAWLTPLQPTANHPAFDQQRVFYVRTGSLGAVGGAAVPVTSNVGLYPGNYAVVGPREITKLGSQMYMALPNPMYMEAEQKLVLPAAPAGVPGTFTATDHTAAPGMPIPSVPGAIQQPLGLVVAADAPATWMNANRLIGLNISEPLPQGANYYPEPNPTNNAWVPADAYDDPAAPTNMFLDQPLDYAPNRPLSVTPALQRSGTHDNYKTAFLQRLANPLLPWNPEATDPNYGAQHNTSLPINPYITVDWTSLDLHVYSGEERVTNAGVSTEIRAMPPTGGTPDTNLKFRSRERGNHQFNLWSYNAWWYAGLTTNPMTQAARVTNGSTATADPNYNLQHRAFHSLGFLNSVMNIDPMTNTPSFVPPNPAPPGYVGSPLEPFPWLTFGNRPYANSLELTMVPATSGARLGQEYSLPPKMGPLPNNVYNNYVGNERHLMNFFHAEDSGNPAPDQAAHFYQVFDLLETPSPFIGTQRYYRPDVFATDPFAQTYRPPFNRLSRFRDPGRININTVFLEANGGAPNPNPDPATGETNRNHVLEGLMKLFPAMDPSLIGNLEEQLRLSRQGYLGTGLNPAFPTRFANPFRSSAAARMMPLPAMNPARPVEATLLRSDALLGNPPGSPLFSFTSTNPWENTYQQQFFRYQGMRRLENLVTTHSNVYAVWITIGRFEVEADPAGPTAAHPDGYRLAQELGSDNGTVERHRAFYIIDRSIPVAYEPGQNHNVDRAVLLRRIIE